MQVLRGTVVGLRVYDVADRFDLKAVERLMEGRAKGRLHIAPNGGHAVDIREPPVTLVLGTRTVRLGAEQYSAEVFARVWDYGVVSVQFHLPIPSGTPWSKLVTLAAQAEDDNDLDEVSLVQIAEVSRELQPAAEGLHPVRGVEDYIVYLLDELAGVNQACELPAAADLPALILGEPIGTLSERTERAILEHTLAYSKNDLAVVDWNSAVVVEPTGHRAVFDVLEFAVTHLTEFRYFDELLDERLERLYASVAAQRQPGAFMQRDFQNLIREASALYLEFSDYVERVENSLKFVGDLHLANVFRTAVARFDLKEWEQGVMRKLDIVAKISELLNGEVNVRRSHWLEIIIIALIFYEIVAAALKLS